MRIKKGMRVRKVKCPSCVFTAPEDGGIILAHELRREEIKLNCLRGVNQICHHDNDKTVCRGGRDFQLQCWFRMGLIPAPTDAALRKAMLSRGIKPGSHI